MKKSELANTVRKSFSDFAKKLNLSPDKLSAYQITDALNTIYKSVRGQFITMEDEDYTNAFKAEFEAEILIIEEAKAIKESNSKKEVEDALENLKEMYPSVTEKTETIVQLKEIKMKTTKKTTPVVAKKPLVKPNFEVLEESVQENIMQIFRGGINSVHKFKEVIQTVKDNKLCIFSRRRGEQVVKVLEYRKSKKTPDRYVAELELESGDKTVVKLDCFSNFYEVR